MAASAGLAACAVPADPLTEAELKARVDTDLSRIFADQEPLTGPLTIHEAMARVLKYNLDNKLKVMEEALSQRQVDVATVSLLPRMSASAGYVARSNVSASSSQSITTGRTSLETSTSQEKEREVADLSVSWNILDFGVSYVSARQQNDRALIAAERRRKVIHNILQDTRQVFWRAAAAERLDSRIGPLLRRIDGALRNSEAITALRLSAPLEALTYQRALLRARQQLLDLQRELQVAKTQLATLMGLPPTADMTLSVPARKDQVPPRLELTPRQIEEEALLRRPELVEEAYQMRIGASETTKAMLRMLPGVDLGTSLNVDSNDFLLHKRWADYSARVVWNLFNLFSGPANIRLAEAQEQFIDTRRLALAAAVLTQSRVSWLRYTQALADWQVAHQVEGIEQQIAVRVRDEVAAERRGELEAIQAEFDALLSGLRVDLAFAEAQNAIGNIVVTMGFDPLPERVDSLDIQVIAKAIQQRETEWRAGRIASAAAAPVPAEAPVVPAAAVAVPVRSTGTVQAHLGTYATAALAEEDWAALSSRERSLLPSPRPVLVSTVRQADGKPFVLLRTGAFADSTTAERFCRAMKDRRQDCGVIRTAAVAALPPN